jgi:hypothetical protein
MKRLFSKPALAAAAILASLAMLAPASAAPPTVTPSPGYDARLQEQRAAQTYQAPSSGPVGTPAGPAPRHIRRTRHGAH